MLLFAHSRAHLQTIQIRGKAISKHRFIIDLTPAPHDFNFRFVLLNEIRAPHQHEKSRISTALHRKLKARREKRKESNTKLLYSVLFYSPRLSWCWRGGRSEEVGNGYRKSTFNSHNGNCVLPFPFFAVCSTAVRYLPPTPNQFRWFMNKQFFWGASPPLVHC